MPNPPPHNHSLRLARRSIPGQTYSVTICCQDQRSVLGEPDLAQVVCEAVMGLLGRGADRVDGFVVMPDHLHLMFQLDGCKSLPDVMRDFKKFTARRINQLRGWTGAVWQEGYYEYGVRSDADHQRYMQYMVSNPERSGLVGKGEDYEWCRVGPWYVEA